MKGEIANYARGTFVSLLGLAIHAVLAFGLIIYTLFAGGDQAAVTAAVYVALGVPVWGTLAVLFDMHRREKREEIELERLAADASSSVFEEIDQTPRASRALNAIRRGVLPVVSISLGASLIITGVVRWNEATARDVFEDVTVDHRGFGIFIGIAMGVVGFIFARYVSGMAVHRVWSSLRAGAAYGVGMSVLGLGLAVTHFIDISADRLVALPVFSQIAAIALIAAGAETLLNFVLDIYRPRRPGEDPRPAFDSRVLGLLAAPDRIAANVGEALNYQFGVEVSSSWFYLLLRRWLLPLIGSAALVMWLMTGLVVIEPHQRALLLTFGGVSREVGPGLHLHWPSPIGGVYVPFSIQEDPDGTRTVSYTATGLRSMSLGTNPPQEGEDVDIFWTNDHTIGEERFNLVQPASLALRQDAEEDDDAAAGATFYSLVAIQMPVTYSVENVEAYDRFAQPGHREKLIEVLGQRAALPYVGSLRIDQILASERTEIAGELRELLERTYGEDAPGGLGSPGIDLVYVGTGSVHPPKDVAPNFERIVQASQNREAKIAAAREEQARILTEVAGSVETAERIVAELDELDRLRGLAGIGGERRERLASEFDAVTELLRNAGAQQQDLEAMEAFASRQVPADRPHEIAERELAIQRTLEASGGEAGARLLRASAARWDVHMQERGRAALFAGQTQAYNAAPELYTARLYLAALAESMTGSRVYLTDIADLKTRWELQDRDTSLNIFDEEADAPQ